MDRCSRSNRLLCRGVLGYRRSGAENGEESNLVVESVSSTSRFRFLTALLTRILSLLADSASTSSRPPVYSIDHVTPPRADHLPRVVFYASPTSPSFQHLFTFLFQLSNPKPVPVSTTSSGTVAPHPPLLQFVLRWKPSRAAIQNRKRLVLTGYGAALDIKKSDYLAIDDRLNAPSGGGERAMQLDKVKLAPVQKVDIPGQSLVLRFRRARTHSVPRLHDPRAQSPYRSIHHVVK